MPHHVDLNSIGRFSEQKAMQSTCFCKKHFKLFVGRQVLFHLTGPRVIVTFKIKFPKTNTEFFLNLSWPVGLVVRDPDC